MITKLNINILTIIAVTFILSIFVALPLNNSFGWGLMGIMMAIFSLYVFYLLFKIVTPAEFNRILMNKAGTKVMSGKYWGYAFVAAMVNLGIIMVIIMLIGWFIYFV